MNDFSEVLPQGYIIVSEERPLANKDLKIEEQFVLSITRGKKWWKAAVKLLNKYTTRVTIPRPITALLTEKCGVDLRKTEDHEPYCSLAINGKKEFIIILRFAHIERRLV